MRLDRSTAPIGRWLELSVEADVEAVEAVSEILARVAPGGTSVEPGFELVDEGLGARIDPTRPAMVRAHVPALDERAAERAIALVSEALGHLQAFGLRPIGELQTRFVDEADWAEAWKSHFHVLHIGRRLVIKPSWRRHRRTGDEVVIDLDPGMAFGTGLHPTTRLCLLALEERAARGPLGRALDVGCGSGILSIAAVKLGATRARGLDIDPIAIEATEANARHNRVGKRVRAREGTLPSGEGPFDLVLANLIAGVLIELAADLAAELAPGGTIIASGIFIDREADTRAALEGAGLRMVRRWHESDWVALEAVRGDKRPPAADPVGAPTIEGMPPGLFPLVLVAHIALAIALFVPSLLLPFAFRARRGSLRPERSGGFVRFLLALQSKGTVWIGLGLAITGLGLVASLGFVLFQQPWLLVALAIYAINLGLAYFIQVPRLRSLIGLRNGSDPRWPVLARRQRYISYVMAGLVGTIGFLMSTKPELW